MWLKAIPRLALGEERLPKNSVRLLRQEHQRQRWLMRREMIGPPQCVPHLALAQYFQHAPHQATLDTTVILRVQSCSNIIFAE